MLAIHLSSLEPPSSWSDGSPGCVVQPKASHIKAILHENHHAGYMVYLDYTQWLYIQGCYPERLQMSQGFQG
jgi:hypothetical protein